jgi:sec-independent protein translocase protein TatC
MHEPVLFQKDEMASMDPPTEVNRRPITAHLEELRKRILIGLAAIVFGGIASFPFAGRIIEWLRWPARESLPRLAFFTPQEGFLAYCRVAIMAGVALAMPIVLYQVWAFIRPGLHERERRFGLAFVGWGTLLFLLGVVLAYRILLPGALRFLLGFGGDALVPIISIREYLDFVTIVLLGVGLLFELPLAVFLLARLGMVTPQLLLSNWRFIVLGMTVLAAVMTPTPDAFNMVLMMVPMIFLYGISIVVAGLAVLKKKRMG